MTQTITIPLSFGRGRYVQAQFDDVGGSELAVVLPGLRYGYERPLLKRVTDIFQDRGCDIARLVFDYCEDSSFLEASDDRLFAQIALDGRDIVDTLLELKPYQSVWVIGKSLGTISMGAALSERIFSEKCVRAVWLTPSLIETPLLNQLLTHTHESILVIGTNDPSFKPELIAPLEAAPNIVVCTVKNANHGFENPDDVAASDAMVSEAVEAVATWVGRHVSGSPCS
ncbi:hypothetical protein [Marivita sp. GX14005]|uniref:hypothetical protein n=1 Tax=Marivita sp. GX14005 TaxID=2942276 RepID=UPI0020188314|nr:hypothetical protein [Marivita sp. GX14005]MCL3883478.1 hypothetical protein [Marivita sp. GX14005]